MKLTKITALLLMFAIGFASCGGEDEPHTPFDYVVAINSPEATNPDAVNKEAADFNLGDVLELDVDFESQTGLVVHHVSVSITDLSNDSSIIYDYKEHAHDASGSFNHMVSINLVEDAGYYADSDWMITATVKSHEAHDEEGHEHGEDEHDSESDEASAQIRFHINP